MKNIVLQHGIGLNGISELRPSCKHFMLPKPTISIEDWSDSFVIIINNGEYQVRYNFDQEDNRKRLKEVFEKLGFKTKYEEYY